MTTDEDRAIILTIVGVAAAVMGIRALGKARRLRQQPQGKVIDTTAESPAASPRARGVKKAAKVIDTTAEWTSPAAVPALVPISSRARGAKKAAQ